MKTAMQAVWISALLPFSKNGALPSFEAEAKADFEAWASSPAGEAATLQEAAKEAQWCLATYRVRSAHDELRRVRALRDELSLSPVHWTEVFKQGFRRGANEEHREAMAHLLSAVYAWQKWRIQQSDSDEMSVEERDLATVFEHVKDKLG